MFGIRGPRKDLTDGDSPVSARPEWTWITAACWVAVGLILGFLYGYFGREAFALSPKSEWDIPDILTVLITLVVALYVQHHVVARSEKDRARREYLVELAEGVRATTETLHNLARAGNANVPATVAAIKNVNLSIDELNQGLKLCRSKCSVSRLDDELRRYRTMLSDYPAEPLATNQLQTLEKMYGGIRKCISKLILEVHSR